MIPFSDDGAPWSKVDENSRLSVPLCRIDDFCEERGLKPDMIKMDIEGYEIEALHGAAHTLKRHRPDLAVCTYHKPEHIWEVGNVIAEICDAYTFYFRKHHPVWEAVLYAVAD